MRYNLVLALAVLLAGLMVACPAADDKKDNKEKKEAKNDKDPLAKFSDEDLIKIDFCFNKFCEAVAAKDAKTAAAFIAEMPNNLARLDLGKEADKTTFLNALAGFAGAELVSSQRMAMGGLGQVTYRDKSGKEKTQRMQNVGGRWKITGL